MYLDVARPEEDLGWIIEWQNQGSTPSPENQAGFGKTCVFCNVAENSVHLCMDS